MSNEPKDALAIPGLDRPGIEQIEAEEHVDIIHNLKDAIIEDLGEVLVTAGRNVSGKLVVLLSTMGGRHYLIAST